MTAAQRRAVAGYRERLKHRGLVRLEIFAPDADAALIREIARALRDDPARGTDVRARLRDAIAREPKPNILDLLADTSDVDLDDDLAPRRDRGRAIDL